MRYFSLLFTLLCTQNFLSGQTHSLLKDIGSGDEHGIPAQNQSTEWNGKTYFISYVPFFFKNRIWSTDGTSQNSAQVLTTNYADLSFLSHVDDYLIFSAYTEDSIGIYRSNGTQAGTEVIKEFNALVVFMHQLDSNTVVFLTDDLTDDSLTIWSTDGSSAGTIRLGNFEIKPDFLEFSLYKNNIVFTERSTNFEYFQPVITDGTPEGTKLVVDFINEVVTDDIPKVNSAVGTTEFLFASTNNGGYRFDGTSTLDNFPNGDYYGGFNMGNQHAVFSYTYIYVYNHDNGGITTIFDDVDFFTEPIEHNGKVYFHSNGFVYETDGTIAGTKKISTNTAGNSITGAHIFPTNDLLLYTSEQGGNTTLRVVHFQTGVDSLFSNIKASNDQNLQPYAFQVNDNIIYARITSTHGREYWTYTEPTSGTHDFEEILSLSLSPNPAFDELIILLDAQTTPADKIFVYNTMGQRMPTAIKEGENIRLDISGFSQGLYFVEITLDKTTRYFGSFVKQD
jgi:hypothetical protein